MSTKPTPGPWIIATSNSWRRIVTARGCMPVCEPITQPDGHPDLHFPNGGADGPDAHILAASRDMYEALLTMIYALANGYDENMMAALIAAERAIDKAEGKS